MTFQCPDCQLVSWNIHDENQRYCPACKKFYEWANAAQTGSTKSPFVKGNVISTLERLKEIDAILRAESWYSSKYQALPKTWVDLGNALPKLLAVVEAAEATSPFCADPTVTAIGLVPCDVCAKCVLRRTLADLDEVTG